MAAQDLQAIGIEKLNWNMSILLQFTFNVA
jgi:hypothetical protein